VNQETLTNAISKRFFLTQRESREIIKFILTKITEDLKEGKRFYLRRFGTFTKEKRSAKKVRHPGTGRIITIPERITIDFSPSKSLLQNLKVIQAVRKKRVSRSKIIGYKI
jgi:nucleoid DNA-binding protein